MTESECKNMPHLSTLWDFSVQLFRVKRTSLLLKASFKELQFNLRMLQSFEFYSVLTVLYTLETVVVYNVARASKLISINGFEVKNCINNKARSKG